LWSTLPSSLEILDGRSIDYQPQKGLVTPKDSMEFDLKTFVDFAQEHPPMNSAQKNLPIKLTLRLLFISYIIL
jgi:hypothetical protein